MNTTLPTDSQARKEIPLVSGCLDYFPAALADVSSHGFTIFTDDEPDYAASIVSAIINLRREVAAYERNDALNEGQVQECAGILCGYSLAFSQSLHERFGAPKAPGGFSVIDLYPAGLAGVARISKAGNDKHNPGEPIHHARGKSNDHADCLIRHLVDVQGLLAAYAAPFVEDPSELVEHVLTEVSQLAWRCLALSQELHERFGAPLAPGARVPLTVQPGLNSAVLQSEMMVQPGTPAREIWVNRLPSHFYLSATGVRVEDWQDAEQFESEAAARAVDTYPWNVTTVRVQ